ncbi:hypothetical protein [Micromonospora aurantiaca (nom. illeg.)]|uniref:hypothetical protein n=1 Tax=Micromonospora aurantiaca (nom. illeg.) TaxID=47850 RepID=UPI003EB9E9DD
MVALWDGAAVSKTGQREPVAGVPEKPDQWRDFRRGVALLSMVLFFFCAVGFGFLVYNAATRDGDVPFDGWSFLRFLAVAVPLGVAAVCGLGVYRAGSNTEAKKRGRVMGLALLVAAVLLVVTGVIGDAAS